MNIYYFTGTGNSVAICRELQKHFPDAELKPIASYQGNDPVLDDSDIVGFVLPTYYMDIPEYVKKFVERLRLKPDSYVFAVVHYGAELGGAFYSLDKILRTVNSKLSLGCGVVLPDNSIVFKTEIQKQPSMHERLSDTISEFSKALSNREIHSLPGKDSFAGPALSKIGSFVFRKIIGTERKRVTEDCIHCGLCSELCPTNNITVNKDSVVFGANCAECFACIHWCPKRAIRFGFLKATDKSQYTNPGVPAQEVIAQKNG